MITLLNEIHFWTTQEDVLIKHTDFGAFKYHTKKDNEGSSLAQAKKIYCQLRSVLYNPTNKRPLKLRDRLKELEDHLVHNKVVCFNWEDNKLRLLLSTGLLVNILTNSNTGDVVSISFDKQLSARLQVNIICDGTILGSQVICICNDGHVLGFGGPWKEGWVLEGGPRRHLNYYGDWLVVWGKANAEHPQPWSPLAKDHQRANLHLYWISAREPELLTYKKTDGEPLQVVVSKTQNKTLIVVEQKVTQRGCVSVEVNNLELIGINLKRVSVTSVPLQTQVSCTALSHDEERLIIGCIDGSLALLDRHRCSTRTMKAAFIPTLLVWHPQGAVFAISNERGQLQYYDTALNCLNVQTLGEDCTPTAILDMSSYFNMQFRVVSIDWGPKNLIFSLEQGPLALVSQVERSLSCKALAQRYLNNGQFERAINLLLSWQFNEEAFRILQMITASLMRLQLTEETAKYLQDALGSFHNSPVPLPTHIRHRFGGQVMSLTRRFFHQLVRSSMYEIAFLLAVDIGHHDLFMDLYYVAVKIGETEMAAAARAQASTLLSRCSSEASNCSRTSCSQCSDSTSSSSNESEEKHNLDLTKTKDYTPTLSLSADNVLTTDFNRPEPTTYRSLGAVSKNDTLRINRATYVKAPQVPTNFNKPQTGVMTSTSFHNTLGLPFLGHQQNSTKPFNDLLAPGLNFNSSLLNFQSSDLKTSAFAPLNPSQQDLNSNSFFSTSSPYQDSASEMTLSNNMKKNQSKVKFSDTITAFIVPEVKRAQVKPPVPPSHVTDPQKELADSLPLCHPNDDYLKDFTPVRRENEESNEESSQNVQPKIKVVHFGVV